MEGMDGMTDRSDVKQGTLALMVLKTLETMGPLHGYGIARRIEQISGQLLAINYGTLYPALLKLEQEGDIASSWGVSENNRRAKYLPPDARRAEARRAGDPRLAAHVRNSRPVPRPRGTVVMRALRSWLARAAGALRSTRLDRELDEELDAHLRMHIDDNRSVGMSPEEARRHALIKLGGVELVKDSYRDRRGLPLLETISKDVRFALRLVRRSPGFSAVILLTLAIGIGANTVMFSIVNTLLLRPLPYREPDRLMSVQAVDGVRRRPNPTAPPDFYRYRQENRTLEQLEAFYVRPYNLTGGREPERLQTLIVSSGFFNALGVPPSIGRGLVRQDEEWGSHRVAIISHGLWQRRFGGDPSLVGQPITLNGQPFVVVGILPREFSFLGMAAQLFVPMSFEPGDHMNSHSNHFLQMFGRLKPDVSREQAIADLGGHLEIHRRRAIHQTGHDARPDAPPRRAGRKRRSNRAARASGSRRLRAPDFLRKPRQPVACTCIGPTPRNCRTPGARRVTFEAGPPIPGGEPAAVARRRLSRPCRGLCVGGHAQSDQPAGAPTGIRHQAGPVRTGVHVPGHDRHGRSPGPRARGSHRRYGRERRAEGGDAYRIGWRRPWLAPQRAAGLGGRAVARAARWRRTDGQEHVPPPSCRIRLRSGRRADDANQPAAGEVRRYETRAPVLARCILAVRDVLHRCGLSGAHGPRRSGGRCDQRAPLDGRDLGQEPHVLRSSAAGRYARPAADPVPRRGRRLFPGAGHPDSQRPRVHGCRHRQGAEGRHRQPGAGEASLGRAESAGEGRFREPASPGTSQGSRGRSETGRRNPARLRARQVHRRRRRRRCAVWRPGTIAGPAGVRAVCARFRGGDEHDAGRPRGRKSARR